MKRLTRCVGYRNGNPVYATNIDMRRIGAVDKLKNALGVYEDLEEECMKDNQVGLHELCEKWKVFFEDIEELLDYRKKQEQGLLKILPCKEGDTVYRIYDDCEFPGDCHTKRMCKGCEYRNLFFEEQTFCISMLSQDGTLGHPYYKSIPEAEEALARMKGE